MPAEEKQAFVPYEFGFKPNKTVVAIIVGIIIAIIFAVMVAIVVVVALSRSGSADFNIQGHRGCRGLLPENTIIGFQRAVDLGVSTLQLDVVVSRDSQVVVSFLHYLSNEFCRGPQGQIINSLLEARTRYNMYNMTYAEISQCDCGSLGNPLFPSQEKVRAVKPTLNDAIDAVERYVQLKNYAPVWYNVEVRSKPATDNTFHPAPAQFARLVFNILRSKKILQKSTVQSEDVRILKEMRALDTTVDLSLAIREPNANETGYIQSKLDSLGFLPHYVMIDSIYMSKEISQYTKERNILLYTFPASAEVDMLEAKANGANGIITDYPDVALRLKRESRL